MTLTEIWVQTEVWSLKMFVDWKNKRVTNFRYWKESKVWGVIHVLIEWVIHTFLYRPYRKINNGKHSLQNNAPRHSNLKRSNYFKKLVIQCCILECLLKQVWTGSRDPILSVCHFYITSGKATKTLAVRPDRSQGNDRQGDTAVLTAWQLSEGDCESANPPFMPPEQWEWDMIKDRKVGWRDCCKVTAWGFFPWCIIIR